MTGDILGVIGFITVFAIVFTLVLPWLGRGFDRIYELSDRLAKKVLGRDPLD